MYKNHIWLLKNAESSAYLESSSESVRSDGPEPKYLHQNSKLEWRWDGTLEENTVLKILDQLPPFALV